MTSHVPEAYVQFPRECAAAITDDDVVVVEVHLAKQPLVTSGSHLENN